jgi:hypothetical protein
MNEIILYLSDYPIHAYDDTDDFSYEMIEGAGGNTAEIIAYFVKITDDSNFPGILISYYGVILRDVNKRFGFNSETEEPLLGFGKYSNTLPVSAGDINPENWILNTELPKLPYDSEEQSDDFKSMDIIFSAEIDSDPHSTDSWFEIRYTDILTHDNTSLANRIQSDTLDSDISISTEFILYVK